ncbi:DNA segregation ATPase FtsK/SpoIIIE, S-DNA-T family [Saccharicrinis carchari]|uniref:DNA segregation ATPase FtsK/SpoIIIE, S-DNA-T family n=1 Tax=Saccharicrinis carchari TaxID=1168039 RepID=A0A521BVC1_SACCC|nr:DNA translocase FtsK [Saccharicrinis carchari]SMO51152.1 DNA segregation ATPase FtsK/SpoIIIE, S-DNA-T family [Saccharicrinis carchari]
MGVKTKRPKTKTKRQLISEFRNKMNDFKVRFFFGLFLIAYSIFLLVAFVSFIFTGGADHSQFNINFFEFIFNSDINVQNRTGKLGAYFADLFINSGIGVAALTIVLVLMVLAFRLLKVTLLPLRKTLLHSFFIAVWTSIFLGYIFINAVNDHYILLGGQMGYFTSTWLISAIGNVGVVLFLFFTLITYLTFTFDGFIPLIKKPFMAKSDKTKTSQQKQTVLTNEVTPDTQVKEAQWESEVAIKEEVKVEKSLELEVEAPTAATAPTTLKDKGPIEMDATPNPDAMASEDDGEFIIEKNQEDDEGFEVKDNRPLGDYDPTLDLSSYQLPSIDLLEDHHMGNEPVTDEELNSNKDKIVNTLNDYKIEIKSIKATVGPTVTLYEIVPAPGVRISKIKNLEDDIALSLAALGIRIIAPMPGKGTIGIEVPNSEPEIVSMKTIISSKKFQTTKFELPIALGKTIANETFVIDLAKAPHMLVAGATGQGKSVGLNAIITSLLYKKHPSQIKFVLVDPKKVELNIYSKIERHFLAKLPDEEDEAIITDVAKVVTTLNSLTIEMDARYDLLKKAHARNVKEYNHKFVKRSLNPEKGHRFLPYIIVIIDEFADLIMTAGKEVEMPIARIAQLARAVGIHMIVATQRPSTNIITGVIKANFPTRVAFKVASMIDSRTILDSPGANQLIGRGDMLITQGSDLVRVQCAFVDTPEVEQINDFIGSQKGYPSAFLLPEYIGDTSSSEAGEVDMSNKDAFFEEAAQVVVANQSGSTSLIQRRFSIGYNRAGRIIDQLEVAGVVGPFEGSKARQVLIPDEVSLQHLLKGLQ